MEFMAVEEMALENRQNGTKNEIGSSLKYCNSMLGIFIPQSLKITAQILKVNYEMAMVEINDILKRRLICPQYL